MAGVLVVLVIVAVMGLRLYLHGEPLARLVEKIINQDLRGRVHVQSVEWSLSSLPRFLVDGWVSITVRGVEVYDDGGVSTGDADDAKRELILKTDLATGAIDVHALMSSKPNFIIKDLALPDGGYVLIKEVVEPIPSSDYSKAISIITAFYPKRTEGFRAGLPAVSAPIFDLRNFSFDNVCAEMSFPGFHMLIEDAEGEGFLFSDFSDPLTEKLYYSLAPRAEKGLVRVGLPEDVVLGIDKRTRESVAKGCLALAPASTADASAHAAAATQMAATAASATKAALTGAPAAGETDTKAAASAANAPAQAAAAAPAPGAAAPAPSALVYDIPLHDIEVRRLSQLPTSWPRSAIATDVRWDIVARSDDGAEVALEGAMLDYWVSAYGGDYDIEMSVTKAGALVNRLSGGLLGGDDVQLKAWVTGPVLGPKVTAQVSGLDIALPAGPNGKPLDLHLARTTASFDMVTEAGTIKDTVARGAGGEVELAASFGVVPFQFDVELEIKKPIDLSPYLPKDVQELAGTALRGHLRAVGDAERQRLEPLDLWLGRARMSGALLKDERQRVHTQALRGTLGETSVTTRGTVDLIAATFDLRMAVESRDMARWLRYLDAPPMATGLDGTVQVTGSFADPQACAALHITGIPVIEQVKTWFGYRGDVVSVDVNRRPKSANGNACAREAAGGPDGTRPATGGSLWASGRMRVGEQVRVLDMQAKADKLDLAKIPQLGGQVTGTVSASARARGPLARLDAKASASFDQLTMAGDSYEVTTPANSVHGGAGCERKLCVSLRPDGSKQVAFALTRAGGGELGVDAAMDGKNRLSGAITVQRLPLDKLQGLQSEQTLVGGVVTAALTLGGTLDQPVATGELDWRNGFYDRVYLGNAGFRIQELGPGRVGVNGSLLQGDLRIDAVVDTKAPYRAELHVSMRRVELDRFVPALARERGARAWVTGKIDIVTPALFDPKAKPDIFVHLAEAEIIVPNKDSRGRPAPIRLRNAAETPILVQFDGTEAVLLQEIMLIGPAGAAFRVKGRGSAERLDVAIQGDINVQLIEPYVREYFDSLTGVIAVQATIKGPVAQPAIEIDVSIEKTVAVRPVRQETQVSLVKGGRINITNGQIASTGTRVVVEDPFTGQQAALDIRGGVKLESLFPKFVPKQWALQIDGELAGKMLLVAAPRAFSQASGTAGLSVSILGPSDEPTIDVLLDLETEQPLALTPRGLGRELRFSEGQIELIDSTIVLSNVAGWIGNEGRIERLDGELVLDKQWQPSSVNVSVSAENLPFRIPQTLDVTLNVDHLRVAGSIERGIEIGGDVAVIDGRYFRKFNLITDVLRPERSTETSTPVYEQVPLLAQARLDVTVDVRSFAVQNNLAGIQMSGGLEVTGTVREPRFNGKIQVDQGEFKLPGAHAKFTRTGGTVDFSAARRFPDQTPELNVQSEGDYRDPNGQYHLIMLTINGPLSSPKWDLYTSTGLNKGQTVTMLFSGRTPAELRKSLGDEAPGVDPGRVGAGVATTENVGDQILKDIAGDFISLLVEDTLRNLTTLDVARIEIGTGSIGFYGEKELADNVRVRGDFEQTGSGRTVDVRGEVQVSDQTSFQAGYHNRDYNDPTEEDVSDVRVRAVWRYFWP